MKLTGLEKLCSRRHALRVILSRLRPILVSHHQNKDMVKIVLLPGKVTQMPKANVNIVARDT